VKISPIPVFNFTGYYDTINGKRAWDQVPDMIYAFFTLLQSVPKGMHFKIKERE
jgi:hypothetical protein